MTAPPVASADRVLPTPTERRLATELAGLRQEIDGLREGLRAVQMGNSGLVGTMNVRGYDGVLRGSIGELDDGTTGMAIVNSSPPPRPNTPDVVGIMAGVAVTWNGEFVAARPRDLKYVRVHVGASPTFIPGPTNLVGTLTAAGSVPMAPLQAGVTQYAVLIAENLEGKESEPSLAGSGTPQAVVAEAVLDGIVDTTALAAEAVTRERLAIGAVGESQIAPDSITGPLIRARTISGLNIIGETIQADNMAAESVTTRVLAALAVQADNIVANGIRTGHLEAGAVTAAKLAAELLLASRLVVGQMTGNRVEIHPIDGIQAYANDGALRTFHIDAATGSVTAIGQWRTGTGSGTEYILINTDGTIRFYQTDGRYTQFNNITSALSMTGPLEGTGRQGGVYLAESGVEINYGPPTGGARSRINVDVSGVDIMGADLTIRASEKFAGAHAAEVSFGIEDGNGVMLGNSALTYLKHQATVGSEAKLANGPFDIAITWASSYIYINDADSGQPKPLSASNVALPSGRQVKREIRPVRQSSAGGVGRRSRDIVQAARAAEYEYEFEAAPRPERPGTGHWRRVEGAEPGQWDRVWVPDEWAGPAPAPTKRVGPMAEDLPAEYVLPPLPTGDMPGVPWVSLQVVAGLAYDAAADVADDVDAVAAEVADLRARLAVLEARLPGGGVTPPTP